LTLFNGVKTPPQPQPAQDFHGVVHLVQDHADDPPETLLRCTEVGEEPAPDLDSPGRLLSIRDARACTPARRAAAEPVSDFSEFSSALSQNRPSRSSLVSNEPIALILSEAKTCDACYWPWRLQPARSAG